MYTLQSTHVNRTPSQSDTNCQGTKILHCNVYTVFYLDNRMLLFNYEFGMTVNFSKKAECIKKFPADRT